LQSAKAGYALKSSAQPAVIDPLKCTEECDVLWDVYRKQVLLYSSCWM